MTLGISSIGLSKDQQIIQQNILPKDLVEVVGRIRLIALEVVIYIKAFFVVIVHSGFKNFNQNFHFAAQKISNDKKLQLYRNCKKITLRERAFMKLTGIKVYSSEEVEKLKKFPSNFKVYQLFKATISKDDFGIIKKLLEELKYENENNYYATLVPLNELLKDKRFPQQTRDLIVSKFKELAQNQRTIKYSIQPSQPIKPNNSLLKRAVVITSIAIGTIALGYYALSFLDLSKLREMDIFSKPHIQANKNDTTGLQTNITVSGNLTLPHYFGPEFDVPVQKNLTGVETGFNNASNITKSSQFSVVNQPELSGESFNITGVIKNVFDWVKSVLVMVIEETENDARVKKQESKEMSKSIFG